jgi:enoyl-CoA hydratase
MEYKNLKLSKKNQLAILEISRPEAMNALNIDLFLEMRDVMNNLENSEIRVMIITGSGKAFVAGADIAAMKTYDEKKAFEFSELGQSIFTSIENSGIVSIAAINGFALGGGLELALSCDIRIASKLAKLGLPETSLGLIPGFGGTQRLARLAGKHIANELIFSGEMFTAEVALTKGFLNRVVEAEDLMKEAESLVNSILLKGPKAIKSAKKTIRESLDLSEFKGMELEKTEFSKLFDGTESLEGLSAFLEKRKPNF